MTLATVQDANGNNAVQVTADNGSAQVFSRAQVDQILANTQSDAINIKNGTSGTSPALNAQALIDLPTIQSFCDANGITVDQAPTPISAVVSKPIEPAQPIDVPAVPVQDVQVEAAQPLT